MVGPTEIVITNFKDTSKLFILLGNMKNKKRGKMGCDYTTVEIHEDGRMQQEGG